VSSSALNPSSQEIHTIFFFFKKSTKRMKPSISLLESPKVFHPGDLNTHTDKSCKRRWTTQTTVGKKNKEGFDKKKEWERNKVKDTPSTYFLPGSHHMCMQSARAVSCMHGMGLKAVPSSI